jgi:hypothetical protein
MGIGVRRFSKKAFMPGPPLLLFEHMMIPSRNYFVNLTVMPLRGTTKHENYSKGFKGPRGQGFK